MHDRIEKRLAELEKAREQLMGQLNAVSGAMVELQKLQEPEQAVNGELQPPSDSAETAHGDG